MRDPELVARAQGAATRLESAWEQWRALHGLAVAPGQPVVSYVGYSLKEPWGGPQVVIGIDAEEAEYLAEFLPGQVTEQLASWPPGTTVAVFRCVAALLLGVMLCTPDVVTLRHRLPGRGLLPGSGYGEEPGAVVLACRQLRVSRRPARRRRRVATARPAHSLDKRVHSSVLGLFKNQAA